MPARLASILPVHFFHKAAHGSDERGQFPPFGDGVCGVEAMLACALALPFGAPGDVPPCIRQRPFAIAGERHGGPARVLAPQRGLRCMGNLLCTGLFLQFALIPPSLNGPDGIVRRTG